MDNEMELEDDIEEIENETDEDSEDEIESESDAAPVLDFSRAKRVKKEKPAATEQAEESEPKGVNIWTDKAAAEAWQASEPSNRVKSAPPPEAVTAPAPTAAPAAQPAVKVPRPTHNEYGVLNLTPHSEIVPRLDLSQPPSPGFLQYNARATCSICQNVGIGLIEHDCMRYQISVSNS